VQRMKSKEVNFSDLSDIKYRLFLEEDRTEEGMVAGRRYLRIEFAGRHGIGSEGNADSSFMRAIIVSALNIWFVHGLVLDLRSLSYEWGNSIGDPLLAGKHIMGSKFPIAVVVSDLNKSALESASPFYRGSLESGDQNQWLFEDLNKALAYVVEESANATAEGRKKKAFWRK
jgi:hypothetical protein